MDQLQAFGEEINPSASHFISCCRNTVAEHLFYLHRIVGSINLLKNGHNLYKKILQSGSKRRFPRVHLHLWSMSFQTRRLEF